MTALLARRPAALADLSLEAANKSAKRAMQRSTGEIPRLSAFARRGGDRCGHRGPGPV